ncbi:hypothetical protein K435DRAFT_866079 [Dendrothele bispora CBS 962.96]|uniref:CCHC-type domain-containing protein n=1 Tax=Dendrothele bispora (strain CBS 962.96) TaxID=1314807 RepID=A0A4S8LHQ6_DENBC|nr:hypothetical protein K435DRAFT_866079 [Dendrothele bispora CBS 962.96]
MATQTTTETYTQQNDPHSSSTPSPDPNHNSGFSAFTPEGYWRWGSQARQQSKSPPRSVFQGEGHTLRSSSAPPGDPKDPERNEGLDTPGAPKPPLTYLPTPEPTRPRPRTRNLSDYRNYNTLEEEIRSSENLERSDPLPNLSGPPHVPRSLQEEALAQEMLTRTSDPRSPQEHRTPIPLATNNLASSMNYPTELPASRHSSHSRSESPIQILGPIGPDEQVNIPDPDHDIRVTFPQLRSAFNRTPTGPTTPSSHPRWYATPRDALEDVGRQCQRFGMQLGVRGVESMDLDDQIRAVRALAEAREVDLPIWIVSQLRETGFRRELNRLHDIVRQPDLTLVVPEDPNLPDPWNLTVRMVPLPVPSNGSWQQLEQHRALELEREKRREDLARENSDDKRENLTQFRKPANSYAAQNTQSGPGTSNQGPSRYKSSPRQTQSETITAKLAQPGVQSENNNIFRISREEQDRRMNEGLCIRCGGKGHFGRECKTHQHAVVAKSCQISCGCEEPEKEEPEEILYAINGNGDLHQIDSEEEAHALEEHEEDEQGNEEGARNLEEGKE